MINSKLKFYFYKKRQSKQYKNTLKGYYWVSFKWSLTGKALSPEGGEKPSCSWAAPPAALRKRQRPPRLTQPRVNREGGSGGLLCRGGGAPWHIISELGGKEAWNFKRIFWLFCFVMTRSSTTAAGRTADCQPFWRASHHTSALYSLRADPPSKVTTNPV